MKMTRESQMRGSKGSHIKMIGSGRKTGKNRMSSEEFDTKIVVLREQLSGIMKLLQEKVEED